MGREPTKGPIKKPTAYRLDLTQEAIDALESIQRRGLVGPRKYLAARVFEWYAAQPESIQQAIVGTLAGDVQPDLAKIKFPARGDAQALTPDDLHKAGESARRASQQAKRKGPQSEGA